MERKPKQNRGNGGVKNTRRTQRNEACPCGKTKTISYPGTEFPDRETFLKFKNCCLNETGSQSGTVRSTKDIIDERNAIRFAV